MCEDGTAVRVRQREKQSYVVYKVEIIPSHNDATLTQHNAEVVVILRKSYNLFQDVHLQKKKASYSGCSLFHSKQLPSSGLRLLEFEPLYEDVSSGSS